MKPTKAEITSSHAIETVERYVMDGKEFRSVRAAIENRENQIGAMIDAADIQTLSPRQRLDLLEWMVANRCRLSHLLDF